MMSAVFGACLRQQESKIIFASYTGSLSVMPTNAGANQADERPPRLLLLACEITKFIGSVATLVELVALYGGPCLGPYPMIKGDCQIM